MSSVKRHDSKKFSRLPSLLMDSDLAPVPGQDLLNKLHVVADYEGRSANSQILILIRDCIESYEQDHGEILFG